MICIVVIIFLSQAEKLTAQRMYCENGLVFEPFDVYADTCSQLVVSKTNQSCLCWANCTDVVVLGGMCTMFEQVQTTTTTAATTTNSPNSTTTTPRPEDDDDNALIIWLISVVLCCVVFLVLFYNRTYLFARINQYQHISRDNTGLNFENPLAGENNTEEDAETMELEVMENRDAAQAR